VHAEKCEVFDFSRMISWHVKVLKNRC
jgi:hypothetical protein